MGLRLWLPLIRDTLNYGVEVSNVTETNVTINENGKIGSCYSFNGSSSYLLGTQSSISNDTKEWSFACWVKLNTTTAGQTLFSCRNSVNQYGFTIIYYGTSWIIDDGQRWQPAASLSTNTWYHICVVYQRGIGKFLYINGVLDKSTTTTGTPTTVSTTHYSIGGTQKTSETLSGNWLNGYLNDVRFYDHAISMAEIHELSKGLILHYKLDDFESTDNLIVNGFGELGTENWNSTSASYISTTEIPSDHPEIKASFYNGNSETAYIPIDINHTYTISGYIKAMAGRTGTTYPSIYPYDADKLFITNQQSRAGFDLNTSTTLSQPLKNGDTVIHATDLSKWRVDTTTHYYFCAVFGYKNSFGYTYDDFVYTRDSLSFGSQTDKSNIDKTTNTITLKAAYTGKDRPAGTAICQAAAGSTNYYPWGGIRYASITDWVFKTATINPKTQGRLMAAAYWRWSTYSGSYIAGNKLVDNFLHTDQTIDSSGHGYHGTRYGNLTTSYKSARHDICTVFDGTSAYIESDPLPLETKTISIWIKTSWVTASSYQLVVHDKQTGLAIGWASTQLITYVGTSNGGSGSRIVITDTNYTANQWNHIVVVKTGDKTRNVYVNGVLATPASTNYWVGDLIKLNIGARHVNGAYSSYFNGQLSDFRAYATELSTEDVLALYNVGASVADDGSVIGYQMKEG